MKYRYKIFVNGTLIHAVDNHNPLFLQNVRVYLSNPWDDAASASVKNLNVATSQGGKILDIMIKIKVNYLSILLILLRFVRLYYPSERENAI